MNYEQTVSIVVPVYNVSNYLEACVKSILEQTYSQLQIILVDDGSTDDSGKKCDQFAEVDPRVTVIHKDNGGLSDARNIGMKSAEGQFIMFVDSDDQIDTRMVEILLKCAKRTNADVVISNPVHVFNEYDVVFTYSKDVIEYDSTAAICEMWYQKSFLPAAWGKLYKKEIILETNFRVGILYEDIDMMHKVFTKASKIVFNQSKLYAYRHREGSITTKKFNLRDCEILNICDRISTFAKEQNDLRLIKAADAYSVVGALRVLINAPVSPEFSANIQRAKRLFDEKWFNVLKDRNVRRKTKIGIILFKFFKPVVPLVYGRINRWK